jgi:hypothetical protein
MWVRFPHICSAKMFFGIPKMFSGTPGELRIHVRNFPAYTGRTNGSNNSATACVSEKYVGGGGKCRKFRARRSSAARGEMFIEMIDAAYHFWILYYISEGAKIEIILEQATENYIFPGATVRNFTCK